MNKLTIFNSDVSKDIQAAIKALVSGRTPKEDVRERDIRGGDKAKYVNTYYMTRQASLLTGWRWSSKCLRERYFPNEETPKEIGALMEVTLFDQEGNSFSHQSWGSADIKRHAKDSKNYKIGDVISFFDDHKAAYSDGIKKCLSYFGIANDIYGGRDLNLFEEELQDGQQTGVTVTDITALRNAFDSYIKDNHIRYDIVLRLLSVSSVNEIQDYRAAYKVMKEYVEGGRKA